jgi:hypothetical protein
MDLGWLEFWLIPVHLDEICALSSCPSMIILATEGLVDSEVAIASNLKQFLLVLCVSLSVATLPQIFSWLRQIPHTLLLVIVGSCLAFH